MFMKKKNQKIIILSLLSLSFFLTIFMLSSNGVAWRNGGFGGNKTNRAYTVSNYKMVYNKDHSTYNQLYYGTHDWIAEGALLLLYTHINQNEFVQKMMNNELDLKMWFLLGTEVPDAAISAAAQKKPFQVTTGLGYVIRSEEFINPRSHSLRYDGTTLMSTNLATGANTMFNKATGRLLNLDCEGAAYYMGAMCHYIADAAFYPHLLPNEADFHSDNILYKNRMQSLTQKKISQWGITPFFDIGEAMGRFSGLKKEGGYSAAYLAGLDTYYGNSYGISFVATQYEDAGWLTGNFDLWPSSDYEVIKYWTASDRPASGSAKDYFDTVEHHLNTAVYYTAAAMNQAIDYYIGCAVCQTPPDPANIYSWATHNYLFIFLAIMGAMATLFTVGTTIIVKKII